MKFKIIELYWYSGVTSVPIVPVDISINEIVYYPKETRFCSKKAAEKVMTKLRRQGHMDSMMEENRLTKQSGMGRTYKAVLE